jgi:hypothetical protein
VRFLAQPCAVGACDAVRSRSQLSTAGLQLSEHLTLDQTHQAVQERLARYQVTISRRKALYLFEAYCSLLPAA